MQILLRPLVSAGLLALAFVSAGCQQVRDVTAYFRGETPGKYARMMEEPSVPDDRRIGINHLVARDFAQREPYTTRYRQIFETETDPLVRAAALRALNVSRDAGAVDLYVKALADPETLVRLEGAKALGHMPDPSAVDALLRVLNAPDEDKDVRIAAASALRHYPRLDVARALVATLESRAFDIAWQARRSLRRITGVDYAYDDAAWLEYISNPTQPLG